MRGTLDLQMSMLTTVGTESMVPSDHPLRRIRAIVDAVLAEMDGTFEEMYSEIGRPSVPPETLLKATVLMAMFSIRSERAFCQHLTYNLLFKWFLDLPIDAPVFDETTFGKNRERLLDAEVADEFLATVVKQARLRRYISSEHFSVDGTLLEAWASHKSFRPKDDSRSDPPAGRNAERDFHGEKRTNETHRSTTDPEARMMRKGNSQAAKLRFMGHALVENRSSLIVGMDLTQADGFAERATALELLGALSADKRRRTVAADKAYDTMDFVAGCRELNVTPHVAQNITPHRESAIDGRTTRHPGHYISLRLRKRVEEPFGWIKTIAGGRKLRYIGRQRNRAWFLMTGAVYDIIRIAALDAATA